VRVLLIEEGLVCIVFDGLFEYCKIVEYKILISCFGVGGMGWDDCGSFGWMMASSSGGFFRIYVF
jgi:hypothetical protein